MHRKRSLIHTFLSSTRTRFFSLPNSLSLFLSLSLSPFQPADTICGLINGNDANAAGFCDYTRRVHVRVSTYTRINMRGAHISLRTHNGEWPFYKQLYMQL